MDEEDDQIRDLKKQKTKFTYQVHYQLEKDE